MEYALRYESIATKRRLKILITTLWGSSVVVSGLVLLVEQFGLANVYGVWAYRILCIGCAFVLLFSSLWVRGVRNQHLSEIEKLNNYFGVHGEEFNLLKRTGNCITEVVQLNIFTALLILAASVTHLSMIYYKAVTPFFIGSTVAYILSNPIVYMLVMTDLRTHYLMYMKRLSNKFVQTTKQTWPSKTRTRARTTTTTVVDTSISSGTD